MLITSIYRVTVASAGLHGVELTYSKAITAPIDPESHNVPYGIADNGIVPVEVWLFAYIEVEIVLSCLFVKIPCRAFRRREIKWRLGVATLS